MLKRLLPLVLIFSGCSVSNQHVDNVPPKVRRDLVSFGATYGSFKVNQVSAFLWPENVSEDEIQNLVRTINGASEAADPYMVDAATLTKEDQRLQAEWDYLGSDKEKSCVQAYAVLAPGQDPTDVDTVTAWKSDDDVKDPILRAERDACQANQVRRQEIPALKDADVKAARPYLEIVIKTIDPDPTNVQNSRALDVSGTRITLNENGAPDVSLGNFLVNGYSPSTSNADPIKHIANASYDGNTRVLTFDVNEVVLGRDALTGAEFHTATGNVYRFALERGPDHGPLARFTGDMNLVSASGTILRHGSARFDAFPPQ